MAHFTVTLTSTKTIPEAAMIVLKNCGLSLANAYDDLGCEFEEVKPGFAAKVMQDDDPPDPRRDENIGVMFCRHSRYRLGDKDAKDPFVEVEFKMIHGVKVRADAYNGETELPSELKEVFDLTPNDLVKGTDEYSDEFNAWFEDEWRTTETDSEKVLRHDIAIILPIYMYDHGSTTISHSSFSCQWDSGQVGWHYITKKDLQENWKGDEEAGKRRLAAELEEYDHYLRGSVWGYVVENEEGEEVDSCWGFYGDDLEETGMLGNVASEHVEAVREAWERRFYQ